MTNATLSPARTWLPVLSGETAARAVRIATDVAARLNDSQTLSAAVHAAMRQSSFPTTTRWDPSSIAQGHTGLAIMCGYLDASLGDGSDATAHRHLGIAARAAEREWNRGAGIFSGYGGLVLAGWLLGRGGTRYEKLLGSLKTALLPQIAASAQRLAGRAGMGFGEFDVISGAAGIVAYLLPLREDPEVASVLRALLGALVALLAETGDELPRWYTPPSMLGDPKTVDQYPFGNLNCGLAHGIPGPLAALALAQRDGVRVAGMEDALRRTAAWVADHRIEDPWGVAWPYAVPLTGDDGVPRREAPDAAWRNGPSRSAWCYGSPGVARALWLAGDALGDDALCALAVEAMEAVLRRPVHVRGIDAPTLCHGVGGVLAIMLRFAADTQLAVFADGARALCDQILAEYDSTALLGFRDLEPGNVRVDRPGLLDGAAGLVLVLLAAASEAEPAWDRLFMIS
ncbi:MAG TPA: lanthionine synthetase C family protein [Candidatus Limnocylindrales bacterium]|nr:lanthionine synthetase C family protein [Candidatus Limnocylindrales bacterium]